MLLIGFVLAALLLFLTFDVKTFMGGDNAYYASLAKSLMGGHYRVEAFIHPPPETGVPPGYPMILAVLMAIFGKTFLPAKILSFFCFLAALWLWWIFFRREGIGAVAAFALVTFAVLNYKISEFSHWELTEAIYMLITTAAILWFFEAMQKDRFIHWVIAGVLSVAAYYIRATGATVSMALFATLLFRRRWRAALIFAATNALLLAPWLVRNLIVAGQLTGGAYSSQFFTNPATGTKLTATQFAAKVIFNFTKYISLHLPTLFLPLLERTLWRAKALGAALGAVLFGLAVWGAVDAAKRKREAYALYLLLYIALLSMFNPQAVILRYLVVVYPFWAALVFRGLALVDARLGARRFIASGAAALIAVLALPVYISHASQAFPTLIKNLSGNRFAGYHPVYARFIEASEWLAKNASDARGVISRKPRLSWWFSGIPSREYLRSSPDTVMADIDTSGANYVIVDRISATTPQFLVPAVQRYRNRFAVVHITGEPATYVLRLLPKPSFISPDSVISEPAPAGQN